MVQRAASVILILALVLAWVLLPGAIQAQVSYLGELCWDVRGTGPDVFRLQLGVASGGDGHFLMNGQLAQAGGNRIQPIHGNAELVGNTVLMTLVASSGVPLSGFREAGTLNVVVNLSDLGGTFKRVGLVGGEAPPEVVTDDGTLTRVACQ